MFDTFKERVNKLRKRRYKSYNKRMKYFMVVFIVGYAIFFTSQLWLPPTYVGVPVTKVGGSISANNRQVKVDSIDYSKKDRVIEVILEIDNLSIDGVNSYNFKAKDRRGNLKTEVVSESNKFVVLHIKKVSRRWTEIGIVISLKAEDEKKNTDFDPMRVYISNKIAKNVDTIDIKSDEGYVRLAKKRQIEGVEEQITELKHIISKNNKDIKSIKGKISELKKEKEVQTVKEKQVTDTNINELELKKNELSLKNKDAKNDIADLQEKIKVLNGE